MSVRFGVDMSANMGIASLGRRDWDFDTEDSKENKMNQAEFLKLYTETDELLDQKSPYEQRAEAIELVFICAQDIVKAWPELSIRTLGQMTKRIDTLRQALEAAKK
jgi:hypothetical protein